MITAVPTLIKSCCEVCGLDGRVWFHVHGVVRTLKSWPEPLVQEGRNRCGNSRSVGYIHILKTSHCFVNAQILRIIS